MAQTSPRLKRARRVKRQLTLAHRAGHAISEQRVKTAALLFAVLQENGGSLLITQATLDQVHRQFMQLRTDVQEVNPGEYKLTLVGMAEAVQP